MYLAVIATVDTSIYSTSGKQNQLVQTMLNTTQPYQKELVFAATDLLGYKIVKCNNPVFLQIDDSGNIGYKRLRREEQNKCYLRWGLNLRP